MPRSLFRAITSNHTVDVCPRIAVLEHGVIIRDLVNENNSAEKELEDYFNVEEE